MLELRVAISSSNRLERRKSVHNGHTHVEDVYLQWAFNERLRTKPEKSSDKKEMLLGWIRFRQQICLHCTSEIQFFLTIPFYQKTVYEEMV